MFKFNFFLILLSVIFMASVVLADDMASQKEISYSQFLEWRGNKETVILDSWALEPLQWISPKDIVEKTGRGITQDDFDHALSTIIPSKNTRVILYCYQSFEPTRMVSAKFRVADTLRANGYTNVHELEDLWKSPTFSVNTNFKDILNKEVAPYQTPLNDKVKELIERARTTNSDPVPVDVKSEFKK